MRTIYGLLILLFLCLACQQSTIEDLRPELPSNEGFLVLELDTDGNCCKDAMPRSELVSIMSKNGFTLIDQRDFLETAFLKFQKND